MPAKEFSQYHEMVSRLAHSSLPKPPGQHPSCAPLGTAPAHLLLNDDPQWYSSLAHGAAQLVQLAQSVGQDHATQPPRLTDHIGHHRPVYWPLVIHLHLAAFTLRYESLPQSLWGQCEDILPQLAHPARIIESYADTPAPPDQAAMVLWLALCLLEYAMLTSRDVDVELVDAVVYQVITRHGPDLSLHPQGLDPTQPNSEPPGQASLDWWTYTELSGLHALANLALVRRNKTWAKRVQEIAIYHLNHSQPDHTTNQPWAVFAFLWSDQTCIFAEQQLHDATAHKQGSPTNTMPTENQVNRIGPLDGMLLADAAAALGAFEK